MPTFCITPARAVIVAVWRGGTWSATLARYAAKAALAASWPTNHAIIRIGTLSETAMTNRQSARPTPPPTSHGRRRPHRDVVRSDNRPNTGFPIRAASAPTPRIRPAAVGASAGPTTAVTLIAMLTITGPSSAMNSASWAKANATTNPGRTFAVGGGMSWPGTERSWPGSPDVTIMPAPVGLLRGWLGSRDAHVRLQQAMVGGSMPLTRVTYACQWLVPVK